MRIIFKFLLNYIINDNLSNSYVANLGKSLEKIAKLR